MKKLGRVIAGVCAGALTAGLTPYRVKREKDTGVYEVKSLLWAVKKTPMDGRDFIVLEIFPFINKEEKQAKADQLLADLSAGTPAE